MECTQRLDPELSQTHSDRICSEQIGFLGILGTKYPVKRGPNKIGRDPQSCSVVLDLKSISRQHAVLNILNGKNYMLMDLDSANKTRLNNKALQPYIPIPISNGDTVQFGEVFGIFRLLEEESDLPCTQAVDLPCTQIDVPDTPAIKRATRIKHATVPESPDVSDKDDSFIIPSQPKPQHKYKNLSSNFIKPSSKTITIQPVGTNQIDNIYWSSTKKSNSFNLDDSTNSLNESQNEDVREALTSPLNDDDDSIYTAETQLPPKSDDDSIYSAETQLPPKCPSIYSQDTQLPPKCPSIYSQDTQMPPICSSIYTQDTQLPPKCASIYSQDTQLPPKCVSIYSQDTQLPPKCASIYSQDTQLPPTDLVSNKENYNNIFNAEIKETDISNEISQKNKTDENIFEAETQLPYNEFDLKDEACININDMETQAIPVENKMLDTIFTAETQSPPKKTHTIYNQETQLPRHNKFQDSLNSVPDDIRLSSKANVDSIDLENTSKDKSDNKSDVSNEVILFDEMEGDKDFEDLNASQPILGGIDLPQKEESEEIPLSQPDTLTDEDFEIRLEDNKIESNKAKNDADSDVSTDCEELGLLPAQKIATITINHDGDTDCEDDVTDGKKRDDIGIKKTKQYFDEVATQIIPAAEPNLNFEDLATQVIPEIDVDQKNNTKSTEKPTIKQNLEDMLTQVIPENNCDEDSNFGDLPTQVIPENVPKVSNDQFSEEIIFSPFKVPLQAALKNKKKDMTKVNDIKKSLLLKNKATDSGNEKYYAATQELLEDLCSQEILPRAVKTENNNDLKIKPNNLQAGEKITITAEEGRVNIGTKLANLAGEMEISVKKLAKESPESSDGEERIRTFVNSLSAEQISEVIGVEDQLAPVSTVKRVPSDPSDVEVTPKKVRPTRFIHTLLPDSQEIKTSVSISTKSDSTDSSSESEQEKESQEQTPIVFRKKKRVKAEVKAKLLNKFDVQALPSRIITRTRKPTNKVQESEDSAKKRSRNILKPKFLNDSEQDDVDTEIISENITRLKSKCDKKNNKDTSAEDVSIQNVKAESHKRKSNEQNMKTDQDLKTKSKNKNDNIIDLTVVNEEKPKLKRKNKSSKSSNTTAESSVQIDDVKSKDTQKSKDIDTKQKPEPRKYGRSKKIVQEKITNYTTIIDEPHVSKINNKVEESLSAKEDKNNMKNINKTKDKDNVISEISVQSDHGTNKRKRGRTKKEIKEKEEPKEIEEPKQKRNNRKTSKEVENKDDKRELRKRKKDDKPEKEIRRSKRQRIIKEQSDSQHRKDDLSTVYSVSSESGVDSPKRKRSILDSEAPSPKRTRSNASTVVLTSDTSSVNTTLSSNTSSLRSTPSIIVPAKSHRVLFTAFPNEEVKVILQKLGASIVSEVSECTVVLTLQLRRTFKLLCAVALGKPVAGPAWVQACVDQQTIVDPWGYLIQDAASEGRFRFSLKQTLCGPRKYLKGYNVSSTPSVLPSAPEMKLIVECSGGIWRSCGPKGRWLVVSCAADRTLHEGLKKRGATIVSSELILTGVLRQQLDIQGNLIK